VLELVEHVGAISDLSGKAKLFLVLPAAVLDVFFILWIFTSLSATLNKLQVFIRKAIISRYSLFYTNHDMLLCTNSSDDYLRLLMRFCTT
jgi:hypothetical protein